MPAMTNQQRLVVAVVFVVAVVGGGALALLLTGGGGGTGASPSPVAQASPSASRRRPPSASAARRRRRPPRRSPPSRRPRSPPRSRRRPTSPRRPPRRGRPSRPASRRRSWSRASSWTPRRTRPAPTGGLVVPQPGRRATSRCRVRLLSPQGGVEMCLYAAGDQLDCPHDGSITASTTKRREDFEVELRGEGIETPEVEVTITFPARNPYARDPRTPGSTARASRETNGIQVLVTPREDGEVHAQRRVGRPPVLVRGRPAAGRRTRARRCWPTRARRPGVDVTLPVTTGTVAAGPPEHRRRVRGHARSTRRSAGRSASPSSRALARGTIGAAPAGPPSHGPGERGRRARWRSRAVHPVPARRRRGRRPPSRPECPSPEPSSDTSPDRSPAPPSCSSRCSPSRPAAPRRSSRRARCPATAPEFVTETDERPWRDCLWASAAMLLDKWTNGDVSVTHQRLRNLSGDDDGGSSLEDLRVAFRRLGFRVELDGGRRRDDDLARRCCGACRPGGGAVVLGDYGQLPRWYGRWDYRFWNGKGTSGNDNHAVYVERYDPRRGVVWLMDPLGRGDYDGEWLPIGALAALRVVQERTRAGRGHARRPTGAVRGCAGPGRERRRLRRGRQRLVGRCGRRSAGDSRVPTCGRRSSRLATRSRGRPGPRSPGAQTIDDAAPTGRGPAVRSRVLRATAALPEQPGAYTAAVTVTDRRFGRTVARSTPITVFVPGPVPATLRLQARRRRPRRAAGSRTSNSRSRTAATEAWAAPTGTRPRSASKKPSPTRVVATWLRLDRPGGSPGRGAGIAPHADRVELELVLALSLDPGRSSRLRRAGAGARHAGPVGAGRSTS